jgi:cell division protein FtsZ
MSQQEFSNMNPSLIQFDIPKDQPSIIKVIGVGGGGSNAVNHMYRQGIKGVDFLVCNTDAQALEVSPVPLRIQLGPSLTQGCGAGSIPEVGKQAAIETQEEMKSILSEGTKMVFVTAGMGGGTGTGAAPIIAGVAREMGILTVGIVTVPFAFEGRKRKQQADLGIEEMKKNVDALLIICNDKLREIYGNLNLSKAYGHADDVLTVAAKSIAEIITNTMHMNVDFADISTVMKDSGVAIMGSASAEGDNRAVRAAEQALDSPLLNDNVIEGARYILLNIVSGSSEVTMDEVGEINDYIQAQAGQTAEIIMGIGHDDSLGDKVGVTIIATGFKTNQQKTVELKRPEKIVFDLNAEVVAPVKNDVPTQPLVNVAPANEMHNVADSMEPVLIVREEVSFEVSDVSSFEEFVENQIEAEEQSHVLEMELPLDMEPTIIERNPVVPPVNADLFSMDEPEIRHSMDHIERHELEEETLSPEQEMFKRSRERILRLKEINHKMSSPNGINDLEREPAYKRRNVKLENVPNSADSSISRYTLSIDENDKKPELRANNSFLHDRVD